MLSSFARITLRHFARHKLRTLLTIMGVALGLAAIIGMWLVESVASRAFEHAVTATAGRAQLQIDNGQVGVHEQLLEQVSALPQVDAAAPSVQGFLSVAGLRGETIYVMGIDLLADAKVRDYQFESSKREASISDPLVFLAQPDSVALTREFMARYRLKPGDHLEVHSASGLKQLTVRGVLDMHKGPAQIFDGRLAVMDIFAAQRLFGLDHRFTRIDIVAAPRANIATLAARLTRVVAGRAIVDRPASRGKQFEKMMSGFASAYTFAGALAVIIAIYLIFNTMMISVTQRRREMGILRSLGMRRGELLALIALESLLLGGLGSLAGIVLGVGFARVVSPAANRLLTQSSGGTYGTLMRPEVVLWGFALGIGSAMIAALLPAREAVKARPVEAMARWSPQAAAHYRKLTLAGIVCFAIAIALWLRAEALPLSAMTVALATQVSVLVGVSLMAPQVVMTFAAAVDTRLGIGGAPLPALACRSIVSNSRRVAVSAAAFAVSVTGAIGMATILSSVNLDLSHQLDLGFAGIDLLVAAPAGTFNPANSANLLPLPASLPAEIAAVPGVSKVAAENWVGIEYRGMPTNIVVSDGELRKTDILQGRYPVPGSDEIQIGEVIARRGNLHPADFLTLRTPRGETHLRITGIGFDASGSGWIGINRALYQRLWRDDKINQILVAIKPGADLQRVSSEIRSRFGEGDGIVVLAARDFENEAKTALSGAVAAAYPINVICISIALLGLINSLVATVLDHTRELGILRATAATRTQLIWVVVIEAATVGIAAGVTGTLAGSLDGFLYMRGVFPALFSHTPLYAYPTGAAMFTFIAAIVLSAVAGYFPGRTAAQLKIVESLSYE